jgi:hypothetical protein
VYEGRLAPRQVPLRQMSTGLDAQDAPPEPAAPRAAAMARAGSAFAQAARLDNTSALNATVPQVPAA